MKYLFFLLLVAGIGCNSTAPVVVEEHYVALYKKSSDRIALPLDVSVDNDLFRIIRKWGDTIWVKDGSVVRVDFHYDLSTAYYNNTFSVMDNMTVYVGR